LLLKSTPPVRQAVPILAACVLRLRGSLAERHAKEGSMFTRLLAGAATLVLAVGSAQVAFAGETFEGKVVAAQEKHMTLDHQDAQQVFIINSETKITLDGVAATWGDLKPGYVATVMADKEGDEFVAKEIQAYVDE
jgi:hypothetical protein